MLTSLALDFLLTYYIEETELGMEENIVGMLATSKAGHDKDSVYVIIQEDGEYIYVADGQSRTTERPKRKNKKHIQIIKKVKLLKSDSGFDDLEIKKIIRSYLKEREERNVKG